MTTTTKCEIKWTSHSHPVSRALVINVTPAQLERPFVLKVQQHAMLSCSKRAERFEVNASRLEVRLQKKALTEFITQQIRDKAIFKSKQRIKPLSSTVTGIVLSENISASSL